MSTISESLFQISVNTHTLNLWLTNLKTIGPGDLQALCSFKSQ